jgi:enoyl-CoA hydratase/carnithine racemase
VIRSGTRDTRAAEARSEIGRISGESRNRTMLARSACHRRRFEVTLADPARRNALGTAMFAALHERLLVAALAADDRLIGADGSATGADVVVLRGEGASFCAGFDLQGCVDRPALLDELVHDLSRAVQALRSLPVPVVAEVRGAALAGGCALLAGCDFVVVAPDAQVGYPVHRIGVSPAVNLPMLLANGHAGTVRAVAVGGSLLDGAGAVAAGLATHVAADAASVAAEAEVLARRLCEKGPQALRATKRWLNELDGSGDAARFAHATAASAAAAGGDEFARMLRSFWESRR